MQYKNCDIDSRHLNDGKEAAHTNSYALADCLQPYIFFHHLQHNCEDILFSTNLSVSVANSDSRGCAVHIDKKACLERNAGDDPHDAAEA